jgi:hypothetical protein
VLRRPGLQPVTASFKLGLGTVLDASAVVASTPARDTSVEARLAHLEAWVQALDERQAKIAGDLHQEALARKRTFNELQERLNAEVDRITKVLDDQQRQAEQIDARALPVILTGAALTTFADLFGSSPLVGTFAVGAGVAAFFYAWYRIDSHDDGAGAS